MFAPTNQIPFYMKRYFLNVAAASVMAVALVSCTVNDSGDTIPDGNLTVNYAVQVVPVGNVDKGVEGATVTIQSGGETKSATVNADGIAVFSDVRPGTISGYVTATGYANLNFSATIQKTNVDANTEDFVTSTVYLLAANSTLEGRIYGDYDLDGNNNLNDPGNFQAVELYVSYNTGMYPMGAGNGALNAVSLDFDTYGITTQADGRFSLAGLPNTKNGYFTAQYWLRDVVLTDPVTGATVVINIGTNAIALNPGVSTSVGDVFAN